MYSDADLYATLGVSEDASSEEIRRAYRQRAIETHPDKSPRNPATGAQFAEVNAAYEVLREPRRREIYDAFGVDGLRLYEGAYQLARSGSQTGPLPPVMVVSSVVAATTALVLLGTIFGFLVALHLDGGPDAIELSWPAVFLPIWFANPIALALAAVLEADAPGALLPAVYRILPGALLLLLFQLLLCARLQTGYSPSWLTVIAPLLIRQGVQLGALPRELSARAVAARTRPASSPPEGLSLAAARRLGQLLVGAAQLALLPPKLEGYLHVGFGLTFAPAWIALVAEAALALCVNPEANALPPPPHRDAALLRRRSDLLGRLVGALLGFGALGWACALLEAAAARAPIMPLVVPLLVAGALVLCCAGCLCASTRSPRAVWKASFRPRGATPREDEPLVPSEAGSARGAPTTYGGVGVRGGGGQ